jgi:quercetin dioxygenase-like cupin family protein
LLYLYQKFGYGCIPQRQEPGKEIAPGIFRRIIHLDHLMAVEATFTGGPQAQPDPPHTHPHEQLCYVAEGQLNLFVDGEMTPLKQGDMFSVPGNVPHCIQTLCPRVVLVDMFSPIRQDFL